jgi:hypothetical protein
VRPRMDGRRRRHGSCEAGRPRDGLRRYMDQEACDGQRFLGDIRPCAIARGSTSRTAP